MTLGANMTAGENSAPEHAGALFRYEQFLIHESRLLDDGRFDEWLSLFTDDGTYWVPSEPEQESPLDTVSLMYDDRRLLETRVRRLASPRIYSQEPRSRTTRMVGNVSMEGSGPLGVRVVRSKFSMIEYRRDQQRIFGGTYHHEFIETGGLLRIRRKRVDLVNCTAALDGLVVPF